MFLTYNPRTGQPLEVISGAPEESVLYRLEDVSTIPLPDGWTPSLATSYVDFTTGTLHPLPEAPLEGSFRWDWDSFTWQPIDP